MLKTEERTLTVAGERPYQVHVGTGLLRQLSLSERQVALIYSSDLPARWVAQVREAVQPRLCLSVPPRDECKSLATYADILSQLAQVNLPRDGAVVGLGGGAVTDLAGFAAATYLRGVAFYTLPTTLLAMVDAAVGGKTGVNLPQGKNLVGAFWPPRGVWCDLETLNTLPEATFREGAAEIYKHGLIANPPLLGRVLDPSFRAGGAGLAEVVADAIQVKADIVSRDLTEQGERAFLNFGHTLAHALEGVTAQELPHGQAVGYGMHYAARLSRALGGTDLTPHTLAFLHWQRPQPLPRLSYPQVRAYMARDKKADSQGVRFVLLRDLAQPYLARVDEETLQREFEGWQDDVFRLLSC